MPSSLTGSPISRVPYDVLTEIFVHCLPQYRLKHQQPDTTIAPMLLCHICSSWRISALATPILWSHLSYCLGIRSSQSIDFYAPNWIVLKDQYTFFLWWKKNQGSIQPYIFLELYWRFSKVQEHLELELNSVEMIALLEYISSARYLEINKFYWNILAAQIKHGFPDIPIIYPNPRTLMKSGWNEYEHFYEFQLALDSNYAPSALRHLCISHDLLPYNFIIPRHWSSLTHIFLVDVTISLNFWFSLVQAALNLQLGHFDIRSLDGKDHIQPTNCILSQLSTLFVTVHQRFTSSEPEFPLSMLFIKLHLPALRNLSLSSENSWHDHCAITQLSTVLNSTPALTTLTLGKFFLSLENDEDYSTYTLPEIEDMEPVWSHASSLVHLRLEMMDTLDRSQEEVENDQETLIQNLFHCSSRWLDLHNTACPIQAITIVDRTRSDPRTDSIANFTMSSIRKHARKVPHVRTVFKVLSESEHHTAAGAWNEWGPSLTLPFKRSNSFGFN